MTPCAAPEFAPEPYRAGARDGRNRLAVAVAVSALLHLTVAASLTGGATRASISSTSTETLTARLMHLPAPPVPEAMPVRDEPPTSFESLRVATPAPKTAVPDARRADRRNAESGEVAEIPDPTYYPAKQLDVYPALSAPLDLSRVASAGAGGVAGRALLLVLIDAVGTVNDVSVVEVEPAGFAEYAQDEAKRAFLSAHFTPAYRHGRAVRSRVLIEVTYGRQ